MELTWLHWLVILVPLCMLILQLLLHVTFTKLIRGDIEVVRVDVNSNLRRTEEKLTDALKHIEKLQDALDEQPGSQD